MYILENNTEGLREALQGHQSHRIKYYIEESIDYMHFKCAKCGGLCTVTLLGLDPSIYQMKFDCHSCNTSETYKCDEIIDQS